MEKIVKIGDKEVQFRSSAALPHMYRRKFRRDIFVDMDALRKSMKKSKDGSDQIDIDSLEMFENLAWCFAKQIRRSRMTWKNGWSSLRHLTSIISCRICSPCGRMRTQARQN